VQRNGLARIARHRNPHQVAGADDAVGGIELDPAGARQIDLDPGMGRAAADIALRAVAGMNRYPDTKRAAMPSRRSASIMNSA